MSVLTAYLDASGNDDGHSTNVTVAGFVSSAERWLAFDEEWRQALVDFDYPADANGIRMFHMSKFAPKAPPFNDAGGWTDERREACLRTLIDTIIRNVEFSVSATVPDVLFEKLSRVSKRALGGAYGLASVMVMSQAGTYMTEHYPGAWIDYVFESGDDGRGQVQKVFNGNLVVPEQQERSRAIGLAFRNKRQFLPLQAADILAYEGRLNFPRQESGSQSRYPIRRFSHQLPRAWARAEDLLIEDTDLLIQSFVTGHA